jgi:hypothetical protein
MLLMEDVIVESIQVMGHNCYYIPRESFDEGDLVLGEYSKSAFKKAYLIESYITNVQGFEGQGDFFSKFGLEIRDNSNFVLSRRAFRRVVPSSLRTRPQEGDLVYVPVLHRMFEIKFIEQELMFHSLGKKLPYVYEMRCEMFRSSHEPITTGVEEIDNVGVENSYTIKLNLNNGTGSYTPGETAYQSANNNYGGVYAEGKVKSWYSSNNTIFLHDIVGQFRAGANLRSNTTNTRFNVVSIDDKSDFSYYDLYDNSTIKDQASPFLDLSESNPFGTP